MPMIRELNGIAPAIHPTAFVAENAALIAKVTVGIQASIWYGAVLRGDVGPIHIGSYSSIQDLCMVHCTTDYSKTVVGEYVTVGHSAILHGCLIEDECLIGMGAIVMDNAVVKSGSIVAAGAVVLEKQVLAGGFLYAGTPARQMKPLSAQQRGNIRENALHYLELMKRYQTVPGG
ncbi:MAG: gamma carbonic anhydrase family protein [Deltaproteobacteria bacterium]|nr:gamma carbonic anhydrase family protein [Deltaproteobacteria bacterium]MBN2670295.1 gamma carbonic anhydrase family protein [Deltaproteobacteria bacterium]